MPLRKYCLFCMFFSARSFLRDIDAQPGVRRRLSGPAYLRSPQKRLVDRYGAHLLAEACGPIVRLGRLAVYADDRGPTLITLPRVGMDGEEFGQYKIRTMREGSQKQKVVVGPKYPDDPRITRVGGPLRGWSIDELPQLRNVQEGTMSLVGPRPVSPEEFKAFSDMDEDFGPAYIAGRPGMTGLEQVNGRGQLEPHQRIKMIEQYVGEASLALDVEILAKTIKAVVGQEGAY